MLETTAETGFLVPLHMLKFVDKFTHALFPDW